MTELETTTVELYEALRNYNKVMVKLIDNNTMALDTELVVMVLAVLQRLPSSPDVAAMLSAKLEMIIGKSIAVFQQGKYEQGGDKL